MHTFTKYIGVLLLLTCVLFTMHLCIDPLSKLFNRGYVSDDFIAPFISFVLLFFPGWFFYTFERKQREFTTLVRAATICVLVAMAIVLMGLLFILIAMHPYEGLAVGVVIMLAGTPALIIYSLGLVLLIVNWYRTRHT
ncbi:MAG: hypothetical protein OXR66_02030 [Candidatus Woesearchaeota archaeon]|nr:hypothetical protein [Candidatus Woesearchaeota archaeon]